MIDPEYMHEMFTAGLAGRGIVGEGHMTDQYTLLSYLLDSNAPIAGPACSEATSGIVVVPGLPNGKFQSQMEVLQYQSMHVHLPERPRAR